MNALVRKEIRQLLPAWVAAMVLAIAPAWLTPLWVFDHGDNGRALAFGAFCLGVLLISLSTFGPEFGSGTFQQLLGQPASRRRLWRVKAAALGSALLLVWIVFLVSYAGRVSSSQEISSFGFLILLSATTALALASGGLWTSLLLRQVAAGFWLSIFMPVMALYSVFIILVKIFELSPPFPEWAELAVLAVYSAAGLLWAHRLFMKAQDVQWTGGNIALPDWLRRLGQRTRPAEIPAKRSPYLSFIGKELQLQQVGIMVGVTALLLQLICSLVKAASRDVESSGKVYWALIAGWIILWSVLPFLAGCVAVAEERKLGTLESSLCLPARTAGQFAVKLGVPLFLCLLLGAILPWSLGGLYRLWLGDGVFDQAFARTDLGVFAVLMATGCAASFYGSTLSRTTLQAMGAAVVFLVLLSSLVTGYFNLSYVLGIPLWLEWKLAALLGIPILTACLIGQSCWNFRHLQINRADWIRNLLIWIACLLFIFTVTPMVYARFWESFERLEPAHGARQLFGAVRPQIGSCGRKLFVLLPDGRLWVAQHTKDKFLYTAQQNRHGEEVEFPVYYPVPVDGEFVGGSNWVKLAMDWRRAYAIRGDGTLWRFAVPPGTNELTNLEPVRVGGDTDWSDVTAGAGSFLLLKTDGTLWGWGFNNSFQLGPGPGQFTNDPVRIGMDSDWAAAFLNLSTSVAVKRDGSVWKWGHLLSGPQGPKNWKSGPYADPIRWDLDGKDWVEVLGFDGDMVLTGEGSLWVSGVLANNILGNYNLPGDKPIRIGHGSDWKSVAMSDRTLLAVNDNGRLVKTELFNGSIPLRFGSMGEPSRYSDWLAVQAAWSDPYVALAADGTVTSWWEGEPDQFTTGRAYLGPSRRPLWSLNILHTTK